MKHYPVIRIFVVMFFTALVALFAAHATSLPDEFYQPFYKIIEIVSVP